jgi:hypothetical protein
VTPKAARVSVPSAGVTAGSSASNGLSSLGGMVHLGLSLAGGFPFSVFRVFPFILSDGKAVTISQS